MENQILREIAKTGIELGRSFNCACGSTHNVPLKKVEMGHECAHIVPEILKELSLRGPVCVVDDEITKRILADRVMEALDGVPCVETTISKPTLEEVRRVTLVARGCCCVIAIGGGSVIDTCKLAAYRAGKPLISIPTALSHDGIASATASIMDESGVKRSFTCRAPVSVLFDLDVLERQPSRMISSGCGDMLSKTTALKDWELGRDEAGEEYCELAARLALLTYHETIAFVNDGMSDIARFALSILKSGIAMALVNSSRPSSGAEHLFSHALEMNAPSVLMHGEQVGIGTVVMSLYHSEHNPGWWEGGIFQWRQVKETLRRAGAPTSLSEVGIRSELVVKALCEARHIRPERYTILHKHPISVDEARELLRVTGVIQ